MTYLIESKVRKIGFKGASYSKSKDYDVTEFIKDYQINATTKILRLKK